jgi:hypothetical protein
MTYVMTILVAHVIQGVHDPFNAEWLIKTSRSEPFKN